MFALPQGFEARGTTLAQRFTAWQNLIEASKARGELIENPLEYYHFHHQQVRARRRAHEGNNSWLTSTCISLKFVFDFASVTKSF